MFSFLVSNFIMSCAFTENLLISEKYHRKINKLCRPIMDHLGITYFTYHTVDAHGNCTIAVNQPEVDSYYIENKIYLNDPFLRHPRLMQSGVMIWTEINDNAFSDQIDQAGEQFNLNIGFSIITRSADNVTIFGFAAPKLRPNQLSVYFNEMSLFKQFSRHFTEQAQPIISQMNQQPIELLPIINEKFYESPLDENLKLSSDIRHEFMLELNGHCWEPNFLTAQEKSCLLSIIQGHTAKITAQRLNISHRTVEHHIERIKEKLHCFRKSELIEKGLKLHDMGILE